MKNLDTDVRRLLPDDEVEEYKNLRAEHRILLNLEHQKRQELLKAVEPRDRWVQSCLKNCAVKYKDSKKAKDLVSAQTKEKMLAKPLKEFDMEEFEKHYVFGLEPVLEGSKY